MYGSLFEYMLRVPFDEYMLPLSSNLYMSLVVCVLRV